MDVEITTTIKMFATPLFLCPHLFLHAEKFYYLRYPNITAEYEMVKFLNSFITKNSKYLSDGFFDCKVNYSDL